MVLCLGLRISGRWEPLDACRDSLKSSYSCDSHRKRDRGELISGGMLNGRHLYGLNACVSRKCVGYFSRGGICELLERLQVLELGGRRCERRRNRLREAEKGQTGQLRVILLPRNCR